MAQPQSQQPPPRAFSPPQHSPSPAAATQSAFALPPNKRVRTDGPSSRPGSPYAGSPYAASPVAANTPPTNTGSPHLPQPSTTPTPTQTPTYPPPYTNGNQATGLSLPEARGSATPPLQTPQPPLQTPQPHYTTATMAPVTNGAPPPPPPSAPVAQPAGAMGPPQRPAERPVKDYEYDVTDSLAGTGIDLRAEEQYMADLYSNAFDANTEVRTGFPQQQAGSKVSFYGAGSANQAGQAASEHDQDKFTAQAAEQAWMESSMRLGAQRTQEINSPFLLVALLHRRAEKISKEHNLSLNLDMKNNPQSMGKMRLPDQFPSPQVTVKTAPGPDATLVSTTGSFIPQDAYLVDQLALLSIATKHRIRELVEDANVIATNRQKTSHGEVPELWEPAAAPVNKEPLEPMETPAADVAAMEVDGAADSGTNPQKRSGDTAELPDRASVSKMPKIASYVTTTMREMARQERDLEEARLRRRQRRRDGGTDATSTPSRSGSVAPGTPGAAAPEPEKAMTKKEMKKNQALKAAEASSHANQNLTSSMFAGLGGKSGLFGKKNKTKTYDWMNIGRGGSGTSTPTKGSAGSKAVPGTPGTPGEGSQALTTEGRNRLGTWREDKEKGKNIQLRDWVVVLERDGRESRALQHAYVHLDSSLPR